MPSRSRTHSGQCRWSQQSLVDFCSGCRHSFRGWLGKRQSTIFTEASRFFRACSRGRAQELPPVQKVSEVIRTGTHQAPTSRWELYGHNAPGIPARQKVLPPRRPLEVIRRRETSTGRKRRSIHSRLMRHVRPWQRTLECSLVTSATHFSWSCVLRDVGRVRERSP